jgi:26S proteasome regulatory subunit N7
MSPFYEEVCTDLGWKVDQSLLSKMKAANEARVIELDNAIDDAEKNLGETEVRDTMLNKADYYSKIGAKVCYFLLCCSPRIRLKSAMKLRHAV